MKKLFTTILLVGLGIVLIPALFSFALGLMGTVLAFISNPRVMLIIVGTLGLISLPGIIIGLLAKR